MNAFLDGKRLTSESQTSAPKFPAQQTVYHRLQEATSHLQDDPAEDEPPPSLTLVDQFIAFLLAVYIEGGLLEGLVTIIEDAKGSLGRKATLLLGEVLQMSNRILPLQYAAQLQVSRDRTASVFELMIRPFHDCSAVQQSLLCRMSGILLYQRYPPSTA